MARVMNSDQLFARKKKPGFGRDGRQCEESRGSFQSQNFSHIEASLPGYQVNQATIQRFVNYDGCDHDDDNVGESAWMVKSWSWEENKIG